MTESTVVAARDPRTAAARSARRPSVASRVRTRRADGARHSDAADGRELVYVFGRCGRGACAGRDGRHDVSGAAGLYALASNPSATLRGMPREMKRSRSRRLPRSSGVTKLMASPTAFARPVRPMRWT